jgi:hypothetical protein
VILAYSHLVANTDSLRVFPARVGKHQENGIHHLLNANSYSLSSISHGKTNTIFELALHDSSFKSLQRNLKYDNLMQASSSLKTPHSLYPFINSVSGSTCDVITDVIPYLQSFVPNYAEFTFIHRQSSCRIGD